MVELLVASKVSTIAETALKRLAKRFVEVALVVEELTAEKLLVTVALINEAEEAVSPSKLPLVAEKFTV